MGLQIRQKLSSLGPILTKPSVFAVRRSKSDRLLGKSTSYCFASPKQQAQWVTQDEEGAGEGWRDTQFLLGQIERINREPQILAPLDDHVH